MSHLDNRINFDECISIEVTPEHNPSGLPLNFNLVVHRNAAGEPFAWHSPLDASVITCSICEGGARVYLA